MNPTASDIYVNVPLTNVSVAMWQKSDNFIADKVFPNIPVDFQSGLYNVYDRGDFNRDEMQLRAPSTESAGGGYRLGPPPSYYAHVYAFHRDIDDQLRGNAPAGVTLDLDATRYLTLKALIKREKMFVNNFFTPGAWTNQATAVASNPSTGQILRWDNANATPIENVRSAKQVFLEGTGYKPNKLVLGRKVYDKLLDHPSIIDRVKYGTQTGVSRANVEVLKQLFEIDEVLVMDAVENISAEGQPAVHRFIGGKHAMLVYATDTPSILEPSAGYTFSWKGYLGATETGHRITSFRMEAIKSDRVEIEMACDIKKVADDLGYFFPNIVG